MKSQLIIETLGMIHGKNIWYKKHQFLTEIAEK